MNLTKCDPRALRLAQELQKAEQPEAAILFGSRARGDYREGHSDIDIMLVQENSPSKEQESRALDVAKAFAESLYNQRVQVQIIWETSEEFDKMRRTVNHVVANALRDGIVMPRNPEEYNNRYNDDYDHYEYEWTVTEERYRHAGEHLEAFNDLIETRRSDRMIGQHAHGAMEHALKALISATGQRYQHIHDVNLLTHDALIADPDFQFDPALDGGVYDQYAGANEYRVTQSPITSIDDYRNIVNADVQTILHRVRELREIRPE